MATAIIIEDDGSFSLPPIAPHGHDAAEIRSGRFGLDRMPGGASPGQIMVWDGTAWVFADLTSGPAPVTNDYGSFLSPAGTGLDLGTFVAPGGGDVNYGGF